MAIKEFFKSDPMGQAAAIAYYTIFSLPAVMIITVMVAARPSALPAPWVWPC